jgi:hypothetical protein
VVSISRGRIQWPRVIPIGMKSGPSLLLAYDLERAVRLESAIAVAYWWGVTQATVSRWRRALGVGRMTEGTTRLLLHNAQAGAKVLRGVKLDDAQVERRWRTARELDLGQHLQGGAGYNGTRPWTADEVALLATPDDEAVAARTGRTLNAVRVKRQRVSRRG